MDKVEPGSGTNKKDADRLNTSKTGSGNKTKDDFKALFK